MIPIKIVTCDTIKKKSQFPFVQNYFSKKEITSNIYFLVSTFMFNLVIAQLSF